MGSCLCSQTDVSDASLPSETQSLQPTLVSNESDVALHSEDKLSIHNKSRKSQQHICDKYDRYDRKLLLSGYVRSITSDDCLIPSEIEEIIKQYHYPFSLLFTTNEQIDYKDNDGYWFLATIEIYKSSDTLLSSSKHLTKSLTNRQQIVKYDKLEGILITYKEYSDDTVETKKWIFIEKETICDCDGKCQSKADFHTINKANSNDKVSKPRKAKAKVTMNHINHAFYAPSNTLHQGLSTGNVDWNSPTFQKLENNLRNMKQPNWNSPTFQRLEREVNSMHQQRMNVSLNNRSNFHSTGFGGSGFSRSAGFGTSFGTSSRFGW